ncbi:MAG: PaaI family thioesterase [Candidatus Binatia bacterium]
MTAADSGSRGREFPPLDPAAREALIEAFSRDNSFFPGLLGVRVLDVRRGYAKLAIESRRELLNPAGVLHGGVTFGLADTAVAVALLAIYEHDNALLTIEMNINYLEPISGGAITAEAFVLRHSRRSAYAEVDVWAGGRLAARASTTYMIKPLAGGSPPA